MNSPLRSTLPEAAHRAGGGSSLAVVGAVSIRCGNCGHSDNYHRFDVSRLSPKKRERIAYARGGNADDVDKNPQWKCPSCGHHWTLELRDNRPAVVTIKHGAKVGT